jgi:hypothetical protein
VTGEQDTELSASTELANHDATDGTTAAADRRAALAQLGGIAAAVGPALLVLMQPTDAQADACGPGPVCGSPV